MGRVVNNSLAGRFGRIVVGAGTSSSFSNSSYQYSSQQDIEYWHYSSYWSKSKPSSGSVTTSTSSTTLYVYTRKVYRYYFYYYASSSGIDFYEVAAGLTSTAPTAGFTTRIGYTLIGWSTTGEAVSGVYEGDSVDFSLGGTIPASYADQDRHFYAVWTPNTYTITYNRNYSTPTSSTQSVTYTKTFTTKSSSTFSRTGYTIVNWSTSSSSVTGSYTDTSTSYTYYAPYNITLYAIWEVNTYTLTLYYQSRQVTNDTNFTISSSRGTVRNSTVAYPSGSDRGYVDCTYSTSSVSVTISLTNDANYDYYMRIGNAPTTSTYTKLYDSDSDSYTYTWTPTANAQINIYIYQRYTITYDKNGGSGDLPSTTYKIHGTSVTLGTNNLEKTSYTYNGWNTNTTGTGTHYASGGSYSTNASDTLYADWTPDTVSITLKFYTDTSGTSGIYKNSCEGASDFTVNYIRDTNNSPTQGSFSYDGHTFTTGYYTISGYQLVDEQFEVTIKAYSGYTFMGYKLSTTNTSANITSSSSLYPANTFAPKNTYMFTPTTQTSQYIYIFFKKVATSNQLKYYDEYNSTIEHVSGYEFVMNEDGYYESTNQGVNNSYSLCKVTFTIEETKSLTFEIINYAETNYDFGIFSNLDKTLTSSYSADSTNVYKSYKGSSSLSVVSLTYSNISAGEHFIYIKFRKDSSTSSYNDSLQFRIVNTPNSYWYFEHGEYPQSYVGTSMNNTLNSASPTKIGEIKYNDGTTNKTIEVYTYNSKRYARLQATSTQTLKMSDGTSYTFTSGQYYWFEVEPIRWRVSDYGVSSTSYPSGWSTYGTYKTNFTVVSDRILTLGAVETSDVNEGWAFSSSDMYSNISGLNKTASTTNFSANITNKQSSTNYTYYKFGSAGQQDKVVSVSVTEDGVRVASIEEIKTYLNDYSAKASDMVCFLLGCGTDDKVNYWTRNLGTGLGNGQIVTKAGITKSSWLDNVQGVRLALTMGNGSRI